MQTFKKQEKLCNTKDIEILFNEGRFFFEYPFRVILHKKDSPRLFPAQILISVPKKNFPSAVTRNLLKRRIREAYRKNKDILYNALNETGTQLDIALLYTSKDILNYREIEVKIILILQRLKQDFNELTGSPGRD